MIAVVITTRNSSPFYTYGKCNRYNKQVKNSLVSKIERINFRVESINCY